MKSWYVMVEKGEPGNVRGNKEYSLQDDRVWSGGSWGWMWGEGSYGEYTANAREDDQGTVLYTTISCYTFFMNTNLPVFLFSLTST